MSFYKAKIIEFMGLPRTGKTTTAENLANSFSDAGLLCHIIRERSSINPIKDKKHPRFNYWTAAAFIREYMEACERDVKYVIADRGILDAAVWVDLLSADNIDRNKIISDFNGFAFPEFITKNYLLTFYFNASIDTVLKRDGIENTMINNHRIMNPQTLSKYVESYNSLKGSTMGAFDMEELDTSNMTLLETLRFVESALRTKVPHKLAS